MYGDDAALYKIALMEKENINIDDLQNFLQEYYNNHQDVFSSKSNKSNFRRLVKIFDYLKYN